MLQARTASAINACRRGAGLDVTALRQAGCGCVHGCAAAAWASRANRGVGLRAWRRHERGYVSVTAAYGSINGGTPAANALRIERRGGENGGGGTRQWRARRGWRNLWLSAAKIIAGNRVAWLWRSGVAAEENVQPRRGKCCGKRLAARSALTWRKCCISGVGGVEIEIERHRRGGWRNLLARTGGNQRQRWRHGENIAARMRRQARAYCGVTAQSNVGWRVRICGVAGGGIFRRRTAKIGGGVSNAAYAAAASALGGAWQFRWLHRRVSSAYAVRHQARTRERGGARHQRKRGNERRRGARRASAAASIRPEGCAEGWLRNAKSSRQATRRLAAQHQRPVKLPAYRQL